MKERPILFSAPMVQAILEGRKTQTRRIIKPQPDINLLDVYFRHIENGQARFSNFNGVVFRKCPYEMGTKLWVRETFLNNALEGYEPVYLYKADGEDKPTDRKWKPSIFMPRIASRITLEVTNIRVQRLQDISEKDAMSEGILAVDEIACEKYDKSPFIAQFAELWSKINGAESWQTNPWVWVVEFKRI